MFCKSYMSTEHNFKWVKGYVACRAHLPSSLISQHLDPLHEAGAATRFLCSLQKHSPGIYCVCVCVCVCVYVCLCSFSDTTWDALCIIWNLACQWCHFEIPSAAETVLWSSLFSDYLQSSLAPWNTYELWAWNGVSKFWPFSFNFSRRMSSLLATKIDCLVS